jgi:hypothetical protein
MQAENPDITLEQVYADLLQRSLSRLPGDLARLIYLASTRDYNTGNYRHDGLALRFRNDLASAALELAHRQIFMQLAALSLKDLVNQLELYLQNAERNRQELLQVWQRLEPYRVALPLNVNGVLGHLLVSNVRLALAIAQHRSRIKPAAQAASLPRP